MNSSKITVALAASLFLVSASAQDKGGPSDPQIAGIVVAADQIDIDVGKLAKSRTKNKHVSEFAQLMITDHTAVNRQASALVKKLGVKPEESAASKNVANLKTLKGAAFDKAYTDNEVAYHQQVLDAIDKVLIPNARNAELKDLITKVRPAIAAHLDHAKMVQSSLAKK